MMIIRERLRLLAPYARSLCYGFDGWVVGSGAAYLVGKVEFARDWDVLVPLHRWADAARTIPRGTTTNSHGGAKVILEGVEVDVWPGEVGHFLSKVPFGPPIYAVQPSTYTVLTANCAIGKENASG